MGAGPHTAGSLGCSSPVPCVTGVVSRGCCLLWPLKSFKGCKVIALGRLLLLRPLYFLFLVRLSKYRPFFPSRPAISRCFFFRGQVIFLDGSQTGCLPPLCCFVGFPPEVADVKVPGAPGGVVRPAVWLGCAPWGARQGHRLGGASAAPQGPRGWAGRTPLLLPSPRRQSPHIDEPSCLLQGDGWVYFNPLWKAH